MATRKPNVVVGNIEVVLAIVGLLIFLIVLVVSISKVPPVSLKDADKERRAFEEWYKKKQDENVDVPEPEKLVGELRRITGKPADVEVFRKEFRGWSPYPFPSMLLPKEREEAYFIGPALLTAEPGFDKVTLTVTLEDLRDGKEISRYSTVSGSLTPYPHLDASRIRVEVFRGKKRGDAAGGRIEWETDLMPALFREEEGVFVLEDSRDIEGVTELCYKARVKATEPFRNADKLSKDENVSSLKLEPEEFEPRPALTPTGEEVLVVKTLSPWSVEVDQGWNGKKVTLTVIYHRTGKDEKLPELGPGEKINGTTFRLINIIDLRDFVVDLQGSITRIRLQMFVGNRLTAGEFEEVEVVWTADPFNPIDDNGRIIEKFARDAFAALARAGGGLDLGGATFDYENNFIANLLWRAVNTYPAKKEGRLTNIFGDDIQRYQYQPEGEGKPVKLIPCKYTAGLKRDESLVVHVDPRKAGDGRVTYFAEYGKKEGNTIRYFKSGPYQVDRITGFDATAEDKVRKLVSAISSDIERGLNAGAFARDNGAGLVGLGDVVVYRKLQAIGLLSNLSERPIKVIVQYQDENLGEGAKLLEAPVIKKEAYVKPRRVEPSGSEKEKAEFMNKMGVRILFHERYPEYENIDALAAYVEKHFNVKVTVDQSLRTDDLDKTGFSVTLDGTNLTVKEFMERVVDSFNKKLAAGEEPAGKIRYEVRYERADILLTLE